MMTSLAEFLNNFVSELKDPWLWLYVAVAGLLLFIIIAGRFIVQIAPFKNHKKVIWGLDIILIPSIVITLGYITKRIIGPDYEAIVQNIELATASILWLAGAWLVTRGLKIFLWTATFKEQTGAESPLLIRSLVAAAIYAVALYGIWTSVFDREVTGILVSTGIIAAVLGLALQSVLSDLFSGLAITIESPYHVGDWIEMENGIIGRVTDITWRSTRVLSWNNSIYVIPNRVAASSILHNYNMPEKPYAYWTHISVDSDIPPSTVLQLLTEAALTCRSVLTSSAPAVRISDATSQPFKYMVYVYFQDYPSHWAGRSDLYAAIESRLAKAGISPAAVKYDIDTREAPAGEMRKLSVVEHLKEIDIFRPLTDEDIELIADSCEMKSFNTEDMIIQRNNTDTSLYIISSGVVSVLGTDDWGRFMEIARLGTSDCFGEMSLLTGEPRSASIKALTSVEAISVPKEALEPVLQAKPELSDKLAHVMADRRHMTEVFIDSRSRQAASTMPAKSYVTRIRTFFGLSGT